MRCLDASWSSCGCTYVTFSHYQLWLYAWTKNGSVQLNWIVLNADFWHVYWKLLKQPNDEFKLVGYRTNFRKNRRFRWSARTKNAHILSCFSLILGQRPTPPGVIGDVHRICSSIILTWRWRTYVVLCYAFFFFKWQKCIKSQLHGNTDVKKRGRLSLTLIT